MQSVKQLLEKNPQEICSALQATQPMSNQTNSPEKTSSNSNDINSEIRRIDLLFSKFAAFYGHIWRSQFKDEAFLVFAKKEWREALTEFSDDVFDKAILSCREFYELPPTLPQMILCCRQIKRRVIHVVKQSEPVSVNQEWVALHLKKCREMLGQNQGENR